MRKFNLFALLSLMVIFAMLLGACQPAPAPTEAPKQEAKQAEAPKEEVKPTEAPKEEVKPTEAPKAEAKPAEEKVTITIESWRNDDIKIWSDSIIPAFEKSHPNIHVVFQPSAPAEYNGILNTKLEGGTAGDLITCRPFDASLKLFDKGYLTSLNDLKGMENFGDVAKSAWITDDGKTVFCVPMASVIHGFFYNKDAFDKAKVQPPATVDEFFKVLDAIKKEGSYTPMAMGTADLWESATMGFQNIGPNYWKGEEGRKALIAGTGKFTDAPYVETFKQLAAWKPYLPEGAEGVKYPDSQVLFTSGKAAIYPTGSWETSVFEDQVKDSFKMGIFLPPLPKDAKDCYISDHTDIAMGMNAKSKYPEQTRAFLEWMTSQEFAELYSNALPGFFTLANYQITLKDPIANEFLSWRGKCKSTIRNSYQILSRGEPNLENELWRVSAAVINGSIKPEEAAKEIQDGLDKWYKPAGK